MVVDSARGGAPPIVEFDRVSKRYRLGASHGSLRDLVAGWGRRLTPWRANEPDTHEYLWALQDVSLTVRPGQVVGIVGHNGAGKTTLLKVLSGVTKPTSGHVAIEGRVAALIELGAGFHPDLTGRDNIYLNGAILGLSRQEIKGRFNSIVEFAELEKFIDTPVKRYSSGMYARLGFAVAAHTDPDLLVVDEVLGVGDVSFQQKCFDFIHSYVAGDRTALFVSHNLYVLEQLCNVLIWLDRGQIVRCGPPSDVLPAYFDYEEQRALAQQTAPAPLDGALRIESVRFEDEAGVARETFPTGSAITIALEYTTTGPIRRPSFCLGITNPGVGQPLIGASMLADGQAPPQLNGRGLLRCSFPCLPLLPRVYEVWGEIWHEDRTRTIVRWQRLGRFRIAYPETGPDAPGTGSIRHLRADAPIHAPYTWDY